MGSNLIDITVQYYGNPELVNVLIVDNPDLFSHDQEHELTNLFPDDFVISIRAEAEGMDKKVLKELKGKIIIS